MISCNSEAVNERFERVPQVLWSGTTSERMSGQQQINSLINSLTLISTLFVNINAFQSSVDHARFSSRRGRGVSLSARRNLPPLHRVLTIALLYLMRRNALECRC